MGPQGVRSWSSFAFRDVGCARHRSATAVRLGGERCRLPNRNTEPAVSPRETGFEIHNAPAPRSSVHSPPRSVAVVVPSGLCNTSVTGAGAMSRASRAARFRSSTSMCCGSQPSAFGSAVHPAQSSLTAPPSGPRLLRLPPLSHEDLVGKRAARAVALPTCENDSIQPSTTLRTRHDVIERRGLLVGEQRIAVVAARLAQPVRALPCFRALASRGCPLCKRSISWDACGGSRELGPSLL